MGDRTLDHRYILACGCSHTAGIGLDAGEIYVDQLAQDLGITLHNIAKSGSCARWVGHQLQTWLDNRDDLPWLIIAQWPNPFRSWEIDVRGQDIFSNVNCQSSKFAQRLRCDSSSFWREWMQAIESFNRGWNTPVVNICLESRDFVGSLVDQLSEKNIVLHIDEQRPGTSWIFDSAAQDGVHHSAVCHRLWADRLHGIINELAIW